ncbi:RING-type E3 ubiquitin transferase, partial [Caerostris extrusa]
MKVYICQLFLVFPPPPPIPATDLSSLSTEELEAMAGQERENLEARIRCLRNIQTMLDGAIMQMQQYSSLIASRNINVTNQSTTKIQKPNHE